MLLYPEINPVAFHLGPLPVHWYGLMYLVGFASCWGLLTVRLRRSARGFTQEQLSDIIFYAALGAICGGRLGYMLFYDTRELFTHPLLLFQVWKGGMSFHGGLIGVMLILWWYARKMQKAFVEVMDFVAPVVPLGLGAGRIGNFINGELWGRITDVPWGMVFPNTGDVPRHPSQLYEFFLEGVLLFIILWFFSRKPRPHGAVSGLFLLGYGLCRFGVEFFREPDIQIGYLAFGFSEGQYLSLPMILIGLIMLMYAYRQNLCGGNKTCNNI